MVSQSSLDFWVKNLENSHFLNWILDHFSDLNLFHWLYQDIKFVFSILKFELSLESCWFTQILETPNHSATWYHTFDFFLKLVVDWFVNFSVKVWTVLRNFRSSFDSKLVNNVLFLLEINLIKICPEVTSLRVLELRLVLTVSSWENW